jgi:hypothetical protein
MSVKNFFNSFTLAPNVLVEWLTLLLCIREVLGSSLGPETGYPARGFNGFPQSFHSKAGSFHILSNSSFT